MINLNNILKNYIAFKANFKKDFFPLIYFSSGSLLAFFVNIGPIIINSIFNITEISYSIALGLALFSFGITDFGFSRNIVKNRNLIIDIIYLRIFCASLLYFILAYYANDKLDYKAVLNGYIYIYIYITWNYYTTIAYLEDKYINFFIINLFRFILYYLFFYFFSYLSSVHLISSIVILIYSIFISNIISLSSTNFNFQNLPNVVKLSKNYFFVSIIESTFKYGDIIFSIHMKENDFKIYNIYQKIYLLELSLIGICVIKNTKLIISNDFIYGNTKFIQFSKNCIYIFFILSIFNFFLHAVISYYTNFNYNNTYLIIYSFALLFVCLSTPTLQIIVTKLNSFFSVYIHLTGLFFFYFSVYILNAFFILELLPIGILALEISIFLSAIYFIKLINNKKISS